MRPIAVITSYPRRGRIHDERIVGGAAYTKRLLAALRRREPGLPIEVFAEVLEEPEEYEDEGIRVRRIWRRGSVPSLASALAAVLRGDASTILVSYEANMVGGAWSNAALLIILLLARARRRRVLFLLHQVPETFSSLEPSRLRAWILDRLKDVLLGSIARVASRCAALEESLARRLPARCHPAVIPLAVEKMEALDRPAARRRIGLPEECTCILAFGFLSPYKGPDLLLRIFEPERLRADLGGDVRLIVAGGGNPHHAGNLRYRQYVDAVLSLGRKKGAHLPGFVPEEEIPLYFSAADVVVLPYRALLSSSYPLSIALGMERPVILSRPLEGYLESRDFRESAAAAGLGREDLIFDFTAGDLVEKVARAVRMREAHARFGREMQRARSWSRVAEMLLEVLHER